MGVDNDRNVVGINPSKVQEQLDQLAKDMNNPQLFKPTYYLNFEPMDIDGKTVIYFYVPPVFHASPARFLEILKNQ